MRFLRCTRNAKYTDSPSFRRFAPMRWELGWALPFVRASQDGSINAGARIPAGECWLPCLSVNLNELLLLDGRQAEPYTIRLRSKSSFAPAFRAKRNTLAVFGQHGRVSRTFISGAAFNEVVRRFAHE